MRAFLADEDVLFIQLRARLVMHDTERQTLHCTTHSLCMENARQEMGFHR